MELDYESKVAKSFEQNIASEKTMMLNVAELHKLGTTPAGKELRILPHLFSEEEIQMLENVGQEQIRDLEQSIMMNDSIMM